MVNQTRKRTNFLLNSDWWITEKWIVLLLIQSILSSLPKPLRLISTNWTDEWQYWQTRSFCIWRARISMSNILNPVGLSRTYFFFDARLVLRHSLSDSSPLEIISFLFLYRLSNLILDLLDVGAGLAVVGIVWSGVAGSLSPAESITFTFTGQACPYFNLPLFFFGLAPDVGLDMLLTFEMGRKREHSFELSTVYRTETCFDLN